MGSRSRPNCYHSGKQCLKDSPSHYVCCKKREQPKCITAKMHQLPGKPTPSLQGMPIEDKHVLYNSREDGTRTPKEDHHISTTPILWKTSSQTHTHQHSFYKQPFYHSPKQRMVIKQHNKIQQVRPHRSVIKVTAILAHLGHLMKTVDTTKALIKGLPNELYNKAKGPKSWRNTHPSRPGVPLIPRQCQKVNPNYRIYRKEISSPTPQ